MPAMEMPKMEMPELPKVEMPEIPKIPGMPSWLGGTQIFCVLYACMDATAVPLRHPDVHVCILWCARVDGCRA